MTAPPTPSFELWSWEISGQCRASAVCTWSLNDWGLGTGTLFFIAHHLLIMADGLMVFDSVWSRLHIIWYELLWFDGLSCQTCADYMHIRCRFSCSSVAPVSTLRDTGELHHCVSRASISDSPKSRGHTWTRDDIKWTWDIILIFIYIYIYILCIYDMRLVTGSDMKQCKISLINRKWSCRWFRQRGYSLNLIVTVNLFNLVHSSQFWNYFYLFKHILARFSLCIQTCFGEVDHQELQKRGAISVILGEEGFWKVMESWQRVSKGSVEIMQR